MLLLKVRGVVVAVFFDSALCDMAANRFFNSFSDVEVEPCEVVDPKSFDHNPDL